VKLPYLGRLWQVASWLALIGLLAVLGVGARDLARHGLDTTRNAPASPVVTP
jgi:hypothetical protein